MESERTESNAGLLEDSAVELHVVAELPNWSQRLGCSCGENFPSLTDLWRHQAEGRLTSLKSLLGIVEPVKVILTRTWAEDVDGVWGLGYYNGDELDKRSDLFVELVTLYEGTEIATEGWYATSEPLSADGFFGPQFESLNWAKEFVEVFDEALERKARLTDGEVSAGEREQNVKMLREMVEVASGDEDAARRYNGNARDCPVCDAELAAYVCSNLCCPVGLAMVAAHDSTDLDDELLPF
jgi:hypothetical protein